jgi:hypothetical protein
MISLIYFGSSHELVSLVDGLQNISALLIEGISSIRGFMCGGEHSTTFLQSVFTDPVALAIGSFYQIPDVVKVLLFGVIPTLVHNIAQFRQVPLKSNQNVVFFPREVVVVHAEHVTKSDSTPLQLSVHSVLGRLSSSRNYEVCQPIVLHTAQLTLVLIADCSVDIRPFGVLGLFLRV